MKRLIAALLLTALSPLTWALDSADQQRLTEIQTRWAHIQYNLPEEQRTKAFEQLAAQATAFTQARPQAAEAWIWSGIVSSSWAGAQGGLGALSKVKAAKVDLEKALALDPKALQGSAYTSLAALYDRVPGWPIGFGDADKADQLLKQALQLNPTGIDSLYFWGDHLYRQKRYSEAREALQKALLAAPRGPGNRRCRTAQRDRKRAGRHQQKTQLTGVRVRLLLIEDDEALGEGIHQALVREGYTVDWLKDGSSALHALLSETFDVAVLDLGLPRMDGLEVLRRLRDSGSNLPVLILTARDATEDRIAGLDAGADDYLIKPFDLAELKARLRALLRRSAGRARVMIEHAGICLDPSTQQVSYHGEPVLLTPKEYQLLHELLSPPGRVMTRDQLMQLLYGWNEEAESNTLEVHIHHLRKKFSSELIRTVRGVGYLVEERG